MLRLAFLVELLEDQLYFQLVHLGMKSISCHGIFVYFSSTPLDWCKVTLHLNFSEHKLPYDLGVCGGILHILLNIETLMVVSGAPMLHKKNHLV